MRKSARRTGVTGRRFVVLLKIPLVVSSMLVACADVEIQGPDWRWDGELDATRNLDFSAEASFRYEAAPAATLSLTGVAGSVEVVGSPTATSVVVEGIRRVFSDSRVDADESLADLQIELWESRGTRFVATRQPERSRGRAYEVEYRITLPEGTHVQVAHVSGPLGVRSVRGDVSVDAVAGQVTLGSLKASVWVGLTAGDVLVSADMPFDETVELRTSAGDINLSVPAETSAALRASTMSGTVRLVGLELNDQDPRPSVLRGTLAGGRGTIRLEAVVGDITIEGRSEPGRIK